MSFFHDFQKKVGDDDPDIRQMVVYDLCTELKKETFILDDTTQCQAVDGVIKLLGDKSTEVQGNAVRCLSPLIKKIREPQAEKLASYLRESIVDATKRDIATTALKTMVQEIPSDFTNTIKKMASPLVCGLEDAPLDVKLDMLDVLNDILKRFGWVVSNDHEQLQRVLLKELDSARSAVCKKAIVCLGSLCVYTNDELFKMVVASVTCGIDQNQGEKLRKFIQLCSAVSRTSGHRLGPHLVSIVPSLVKRVNDDSQDEEDDVQTEVLENIIQAFESFVSRCPGQVGDQFFDEIIAVCKEKLQWDPNFDYGSGSDDMACDDEGEDDGDQEDDDVTWKVRKASAKCLHAIIVARGDRLDWLYQNLCCAAEPLLPQCFREREEIVKLDIFKVFEQLMQATKIVSNVTQEGELGSTVTVTGTFRMKYEVKPQVKHLLEVKKLVVDGILMALKDKNPKIKIGAFSLLKELCLLAQDALAPFVPAFATAVTTTLADKMNGTDSTLKTEVLTFLRLMLVAIQGNLPAELANHMDGLCQAVIACVNDRYYKIVAEGLRVCGELITVTQKITQDQSKNSKALFDCVFARLSCPDIDQDVKESAIVTIGKILKSDKISTILSPSDIQKAQELLLQLLKNEMSRVTTIKTLANIPAEMIKESAVFNQYLTELSSYLRKLSRPLRQASLKTMKTLVLKQSQAFDQAIVANILGELAELVSDQDLHLTYLALDLCNSVLQKNAQAISQVEGAVLPKVVALLKSPLLQGHALVAVLRLYDTLSECSQLGFKKLLSQALGAVSPPAPKQAISSVAQVVAHLCANAADYDNDTLGTVKNFCSKLDNADVTEVVLALSCLGEIGRTMDLRSFDALLPGVKRHLEGPEEVKAVASTALGRICAGNLAVFLPKLLDDIKSSDANCYLLLRSLKELIVLPNKTPLEDAALKNAVGNILPILLSYSETPEDGIRNVVAECIGKLALVDPHGVLPQLKEHHDGSYARKATILTALKYTITERKQMIDANLSSDLKGFLESGLQKGEDKRTTVKMRRAAILLFTAAAHNKPELVRADLSTYMLALFSETPLDKDLIREVNLGPFKHKVDDGLELRKAAFECMDLLLDTSTGSLLEYYNDYSTFISHVQFGLKDENQDIQMLAHLMICKLTKFMNATLPLRTALEGSLTDDLSGAVTKKLKTNSVQQEKDRHDDCLRSALRAVAALATVKGTSEISKFADLIGKTIKGDPELSALFALQQSH